MLGPLLFLIFVNDLSNLTKVFDPVLFADDTNLFCSDNNLRTLFETANQELSQINDWFLANKLSLNVEKTKYMLFHKCTDQENIPLKLPLLPRNSTTIETERSLTVFFPIFPFDPPENISGGSKANIGKKRVKVSWCYP